MMNGNEVFEKLSSMTEEERKNCVFPGFFDGKEIEDIADTMMDVDADELTDEDMEKVKNLPTETLVEWMKDAMNECCIEWDEYIDKLKNEVLWSVRRFLNKQVD